MGSYALELNDAQVIALGAEGELLSTSAHAARVERTLLFGDAAARRNRLAPQAALTSQFADLESRSLGAMRLIAADLVYAQLREWAAILGDRPGIWLTSAAFGVNQLSLLTGIAEAAGLRIAGLVDRAVALASELPFEGSVHCIDVELERAVVTEVHLAEHASLAGHFVLNELGQRAMQDAWMRGFAARMVRETRFDPLHAASSEQALFDALPGWLETLTRGESVRQAAIAGSAGAHVIAFRPDDAAHDAAAAYARMNARLHAHGAGKDRHALLLSASAARLPGLVDALADFRDSTLFLAAPGRAARTALSCTPLEEQLAPHRLLRSMPHRPDETWLPARAPVADVDAPAPTHVVYAGRAVPISAEPLLIGTEPRLPRSLRVEKTPGVSREHCTLSTDFGHAFVLDHSRFGSFVNGERIERRAPVRVGDTLRLGNPGLELSFLRMD